MLQVRMLSICSAPSYEISLSNAFLFYNYTFLLTWVQMPITQIKEVSVIKITIYSKTYLFLQCILQHKHFSIQLQRKISNQTKWTVQNPRNLTYLLLHFLYSSRPSQYLDKNIWVLPHFLDDLQCKLCCNIPVAISADCSTQRDFPKSFLLA